MRAPGDLIYVEGSFDVSVIGLFNYFSISCVLDCESRVSLAHLLDFSNFVDLYVLEPSMYVEGSLAGIAKLHSLSDDANSGIRHLPWSPLARALGDIHDQTFDIYCYANTPNTFSFNSYDYWLSLSPSDKAAVPDHAYKSKLKDRDRCLYSSKLLDRAITEAVEELGSTNYTLIPSPQNVIPFLQVFHQIDTPALTMYRALERRARVAVERALSLVRPRTVYLPPLLSILLSRCERQQDIAPRLIELRAEYQMLRESIDGWWRQFDEAKTLGEKCEIRDDLENTINKLSQRLEDKRGAIYKSVAGAFVDALEGGETTKLITKPAFALVKAGLSEIAPERWAIRRFTGFLDMFDDALRVSDQPQLLHRVFRDNLDVSQQEVSGLRQYRKTLVDKYAEPLVIPF